MLNDRVRNGYNYTNSRIYNVFVSRTQKNQKRNFEAEVWTIAECFIIGSRRNIKIDWLILFALSTEISQSETFFINNINSIIDWWRL